MTNTISILQDKPSYKIDRLILWTELCGSNFKTAPSKITNILRTMRQQIQDRWTTMFQNPPINGLSLVLEHHSIQITRFPVRIWLLHLIIANGFIMSWCVLLSLLCMLDGVPSFVTFQGNLHIVYAVVIRISKACSILFSCPHCK